LRAALKLETETAEQRNQKILDKQLVAEESFTNKIGEIKMMMIKNMPKETLYVSFYQKELTKTTLFELRERLN